MSRPDPARADASAETPGAEPPRAEAPGAQPEVPGSPDPDLTTVFAALGDPTRQAILRELGLTDATTASALSDRIPVTRQAIARHLGILEAAGLVVGTRDGREVRFRVEGRRLDAAARWMADRAATWDRRLVALRRLAES